MSSTTGTKKAPKAGAQAATGFKPKKAPKIMVNPATGRAVRLQKGRGGGQLIEGTGIPADASTMKVLKTVLVEGLTLEEVVTSSNQYFTATIVAKNETDTVLELQVSYRFVDKTEVKRPEIETEFRPAPVEERSVDSELLRLVGYQILSPYFKNMVPPWHPLTVAPPTGPKRSAEGSSKGLPANKRSKGA